MTETLTTPYAPLPIEFRLLDVKARKIIRDSSHFHAIVQRNDGVASVFVNREDVRALLWTGEKTVDDVKVFDGDIVNAIVTTGRGQEPITDSVHWIDAAWRFGQFDGTLSDFVLVSVEGNIYETPWPIVRPAV